MDLSGVIESFLTGVYTVTREGPVQYINGRATNGDSLPMGMGTVPLGSADTQFTIRASVQPATGRQLKELPEARRSDETLAVYSEAELLTVGPSQEADVVTINGEAFEVVNVKRWNELGNYWLALVQKVSRQ